MNIQKYQSDQSVNTVYIEFVNLIQKIVIFILEQKRKLKKENEIVEDTNSSIHRSRLKERKEVK